MMQPVSPSRVLGAALLAAGLAACSSEPAQVGGWAPGSWNNDPSGSGLRFFADVGTGEINRPEMRISQLAWGRLVQTFGLDEDGTRVPMNRDILIGGDLTTDGTFILETNPVTSQQVLVIQRDVTDLSSGGGRDQFYALLQQATSTTSYLTDLPPGASGIYSFVPRNATLMVQFDDVLDPATISHESVRVLTGVPSTVPFEARIFPDPNFGNISGGSFYSSRILIDTTVSEIESFSTDPPLSVNGVGLPASVDVNQSNVLLRLPTATSPITGQNWSSATWWATPSPPARTAAWTSARPRATSSAASAPAAPPRSRATASTASCLTTPRPSWWVRAPVRSRWAIRPSSLMAARPGSSSCRAWSSTASSARRRRAPGM